MPQWMSDAWSVEAPLLLRLVWVTLAGAPISWNRLTRPVDVRKTHRSTG